MDENQSQSENALLSNARTIAHDNLERHPNRLSTSSSVVPAESFSNQSEATTTAPVFSIVPSIVTWPADFSAYVIEGKIGQGAFASVYRARCTANGGQLCAIKILDLEN